MKISVAITKSEKGFTLLEVIITIVIAAIFGSILFAFMGTAITKSSDPIFQAQNTASAKANMEEIVAEYSHHLAAGHQTSWNNFKTSCVPYTTATISNFNGSAFEAIEVTITVGDQKYVAYFTQ